MDPLTYALTLIDKGTPALIVVLIVVLFIFTREINALHLALIDKVNGLETKMGERFSDLRTDVLDRFQSARSEMTDAGNQREKHINIQVEFLNQKFIQMQIDNEQVRTVLAQMNMALSFLLKSDEADVKDSEQKFREAMVEASKVLALKRRRDDV